MKAAVDLVLPAASLWMGAAVALPVGLPPGSWSSLTCRLLSGGCRVYLPDALLTGS